MEQPTRKNNVRIVETISGEVIFEAPLEQMETAYEEAKKFEAMGLDVQISTLPIGQSLAVELGVTDEQLHVLDNILEQEILSHNISCSYSPEEHD